MLTRAIYGVVAGTLAALASMPSAGSAGPGESQLRRPAPVSCHGCFSPSATTKPWQIQFQGPVDVSVDAFFFDIDMDYPKAVVERLHARGRKVACYVNAGAWENFRRDADDYPEKILGKRYEGFPEERWVDIRRINLLGPILERRLDRCKARGFDGIDPDNLNGYLNDTGFPLTGADQIRFNVWFANEAHRRGMAVGLKNDGLQADILEPYYDWVINEGCFNDQSCHQFSPFIEADKPVFVIDYTKRTAAVCKRAQRRQISLIFKKTDLRSERRLCEGVDRR